MHPVTDSRLSWFGCGQAGSTDHLEPFRTRIYSEHPPFPAARLLLLITYFITNACLPPVEPTDGRGAGEKGRRARFRNGGAGRAYPCRKRRSASRVSCSACLVTRAFAAR
jgi:hypothetical protein